MFLNERFKIMILNADNLSFSYGEHQVLNQLCIQVEAGESVGIIGCNGAGKSTLLKLFCGIEAGYQGSLELFGMQAAQRNMTAIRKNLGYVFQDSDSQLFMTTVYEDVAFAPQNYGYDREEVHRRTMDALKKVHMEDCAERQVYRLSGGQKKLAAIATVLSMEPELLLMDEPSAALDPQNRRNLIGVINELQYSKVIASHDLDFIYDTCERTVLLADGRIVADGSSREILTNRELLEEYGLELPLSFSRIAR